MDTDQGRSTVISVRAEARRSVDPDLVTLSTQISAVDADRRASTDRVSVLLDGVTAALAGLGGEPLTADDRRRPLSWSAHSLNTWDDWEHDDQRRRSGKLSRTQVELRVIVREFGLLPQIEQVLTAVDELSINAVRWAADPDNPGWAAVRADAIRAALLKGQDYAAALGGEVLAVEHVADAGLLGDGASGRAEMRFEAQALSAGGEGTAPSLDPVPQTLHATIDARFAATTGALPVR